MKYDERTGKQIPESRMDEVNLSLKELDDNRKKCGGLMDSQIEHSVLLSDISVSLSILVDMCGRILNIICKQGGVDNGKDSGADGTKAADPVIKHDPV